MMDVMLTIKDFSEVSGLSARTLRYDDAGLRAATSSAVETLRRTPCSSRRSARSRSN